MSEPHPIADDVTKLLSRLTVTDGEPPSVVHAREQRAARRRSLWRDLGVRPEVIAALEQPSEVRGLPAVRPFVGSRRRFLVLAGGEGAGKTFAALWALGQLWAGRWNLARPFVYAQDLVMRSLYDPEWWEELARHNALVIDECGREASDDKGYFASKFYYLLNARYASGRPTILTCNLTREDFKRRYLRGPDGRLLAARMTEDGDPFTVIAGDSLRMGATT
jgi:DNA replication protein DnaC